MMRSAHRKSFRAAVPDGAASKGAGRRSRRRTPSARPDHDAIRQEKGPVCRYPKSDLRLKHNLSVFKRLHVRSPTRIMHILSNRQKIRHNLSEQNSLYKQRLGLF